MANTSISIPFKGSPDALAMLIAADLRNRNLVERAHADGCIDAIVWQAAQADPLTVAPNVMQMPMKTPSRFRE